MGAIKQVGKDFCAQIPKRPEKIGKQILNVMVEDPVICDDIGTKFQLAGSTSVPMPEAFAYNVFAQQAESLAANDLAGKIPTGIFFRFAKK